MKNEAVALSPDCSVVLSFDGAEERPIDPKARDKGIKAHLKYSKPGLAGIHPVPTLLFTPLRPSCSSSFPTPRRCALSCLRCAHSSSRLRLFECSKRRFDVLHALLQQCGCVLSHAFGHLCHRHLRKVGGKSKVCSLSLCWNLDLTPSGWKKSRVYYESIPCP